MPLHVTIEGVGPRVVLVHGFSQTLDSWAAVAPHLAVDHEVIRVDAPGHGGSGEVRADLWAGAAALADTVSPLGPAAFVGYSMGARLVLHLALLRPDLVTGMVLLGGTAGIDDDEERAGRRAADDLLAERIEQQGVPAFLDRWLALPLFAGLPDDPAERASRETNTAAGLASSLRLAGTGTQDPPLWDRLHEIRDHDVPTLVLAGALDAKFTVIGQRLAAAIGPSAAFRAVPEAGHAAHLERPEAFVSLVRPWLAAHTGTSTAREP